jgi:hypothetical protein
MTAICIPKTTTKKSFDVVAHRTQWIDNMLKCLSNGEDEDAVDGPTDWLLEAIQKRDPEKYKRTQCRLGYLPPDTSRMSPEYTVAMLKDANMNGKQARTSA